MKMRSALLVLTAVLVGVAAGTMVKPMSVEQLTHAANNVIEGRAVVSVSAWNRQHTIIYTYTKIEVTRSLKGTAPSTVTVKQLGGSAGGYTQKVAGVSPLQSGEAAVLFLRPSDTGDGNMVIVGLMQGQFRVTQGKSGAIRVSNGVPNAHEISGQGTVSVYRGSALTLEELEGRVRQAVSQ
jgi:hypothetical protein